MTVKSDELKRIDGIQHGVGGFEQKSHFVTLLGRNRLFELTLEFGPVLMVALAHVAFQVACFLVSAIAETMWALEWVLALVAELVSYQFSVGSELS